MEYDCVGALIYDNENRVFLHTSPKWGDGRLYIIPGGKIQKSETPKVALRREIREELGIELTDIIEVGRKKVINTKFYDKNAVFNFIDYFAKASSTIITPNHEILEYGWFILNDALKLKTPDSIRDLLIIYAKTKNIMIDEKNQ